MHCNGNILTTFCLASSQYGLPSFFSTLLFLLVGQVLLFVSVYDIFLLPAVVRNSIGAMCHAMVMSWILAPSQPGPPPSLPQGYTLSLHLTFQINLLYCIFKYSVNLLSTSFQPCKLWLWHICTPFKKNSNWRDRECQTQHVTNPSQVVNLLRAGNFQDFPLYISEGLNTIFCWPSSKPPHFSTIGGSLFWR